MLSATTPVEPSTALTGLVDDLAIRFVPGETGDDDEDSAPSAGRPTSLSMGRTTSAVVSTSPCAEDAPRAPSSVPSQRCGRRIAAPIPPVPSPSAPDEDDVQRYKTVCASGGTVVEV